MEKIYLSAPHMSGFEMDYIQEAFRTNWISPLGPNVDAFEKEMASYIGRKCGVALSSGTAALHLALRLLGIGQGDLVLVSSLTFIGSVTPILFQNATPIFIDSEPETWNMSPKALEHALASLKKDGKKPKAVMVVNLYGQCADYKSILEICNAYDVPVIEDAAESLGASYNQVKSGNIGLLSILSFNGNKIITTSGGGMLLTDSEIWAEKARFFSTQARDKADHYQHSEIGYNYRMSNILAGIGRGQLRVIDQRVQERRSVYEFYTKHLDSDFFDFAPEIPGFYSNHWLTTVLVKENGSVDVKKLLNHLAASNIEARHVWKPMHLQPLFEKTHSFFKHTTDIAANLFESGLCLPSSSFLKEDTLSFIVEKINAFCKKS